MDRLPVGSVTRGTTGYNRLRRCDRWLVHSPRVRALLEFEEVPDAWTTLRAGLGAGGLIVDGTCDELGHRCC
jgi:hypothetical protein